SASMVQDLRYTNSGLTMRCIEPRGLSFLSSARFMSAGSLSLVVRGLVKFERMTRHTHQFIHERQPLFERSGGSALHALDAVFPFVAAIYFHDFTGFPKRARVAASHGLEQCCKSRQSSNHGVAANSRRPFHFLSRRFHKVICSGDARSPAAVAELGR